MILINETNIAAGTHYKVLPMASLKHIAFQYKAVAGSGNTIDLQFWGTVHPDADESKDDDWVNITSFLCDISTISVSDGTSHDLILLDTSITLAKIKVKYTIAASTPNNSIKVGWNSDK